MITGTFNSASSISDGEYEYWFNPIGDWEVSSAISTAVAKEQLVTIELREKSRARYSRYSHSWDIVQLVIEGRQLWPREK